MAPLTASNQGRAQALLGADILFLILPYPFVAFRLWARWIKKTRLCFNDYAIVLALVVTTAFTVNMINATINGGFGQHVTVLSMEELDVYQKSTVVATILWPTANTLVKLSVLHFYQSIFRNKKLDYAVYILAALTFGYWLATIIAAFVICRPIAYNWNKLTIIGTCGDLLAYYLSTAIINLFIDVVIVALPLPVLWGLQMNFSRKLSLTFIFSMGALICVISIIRCHTINHLDFLDVTHGVVLDMICTTLEPTLGIINACLPLLQPVVSKVPGSSVVGWFKSWRTSTSSGRRLASSEGKQYTTNNNNRSDDFKRSSVDLYPLTDVGCSQHTVSEDQS